MNSKLNELKKACLTSYLSIDLAYAADNDFAAAWDEYRAALATNNNFHAADVALNAACAAHAALHSAARAAWDAIPAAHDALAAE